MSGNRLRWGRVLLAGLAGGTTWIVALQVFFGPAQVVLSDPEHQSAKMIAAFYDEPLPRAAGEPWLLVVGFLGVGIVYAWVFAMLAPFLRGGVWRRGLQFGITAYLLMVPFFEFFLPWNVLREPLPLALLEAVLWLPVMLAVGVVIALVHRVRSDATESRPNGG